MSKLKTIIQEKNFPPFIKHHAIFNKIDEVKKVFPLIGLPNCEKEIQLDNAKEVVRAAEVLVNIIRNIIYNKFYALNILYAKKRPLTKERDFKYKNIIKILKAFRNNISYAKKSSNYCIKNNAGKITLNLQTDIKDLNDKVVFKKGEGLFRIFNKLNEMLVAGKFLPMPKVEDTGAFKTFSSKNIPNQKLKIKFSSDGPEGLWDIATMSMRGIQSCQSWDSGGDNKHGLIGSMTDPFTGIIYLTSDAKYNEQGSKMVRRCVVRLVVDKQHAPKIIMERMYPAFDDATNKQFISFLKEKIKKEINVMASSTDYSKYYIPASKNNSLLDENEISYSDSELSYDTHDENLFDDAYDELYDIKNEIINNFFNLKYFSSFVTKYNLISEDIVAEGRIGDLIDYYRDRADDGDFDSAIDMKIFTLGEIIKKINTGICFAKQTELNRKIGKAPSFIKEYEEIKTKINSSMIKSFQKELNGLKKEQISRQKKFFSKLEKVIPNFSSLIS